MLPFAIIALVGFGSTLLPPYDRNSYDPWLALLVLAVATFSESISLRRSTRTWVDPVAPWLFFVSVAILRDASGGATSGLAPLVALPVLWLALFGTFGYLLVAAALTAMTFMVPVWLVGGAQYPGGDWRRALLWSLLALVVAPVIQRLVRQLAVETRRERDAAAQIEGIMRGATLSSLIATDTAGTITSFSAGAEQLLGYQAIDMVGLHDPGLFHDPDEVAAVAIELGVEPGFPVFGALGRRGAPSRIWTYVCADGRRLFVRLAITELHDSHSQLVGYLGVAIDSTQAVEAERALVLAEERWRVVMDDLPDTTVLIVDSTMRIDVVTGAGAMRLGLGDAVGKRLEDVAKPDNALVLTEMVQAALRGEEARSELNATLTGAEHEVQTSALPASSADSAQALLLARDVSRDRAREREVRRARDQAERLFADAPQGVAVVQLDGQILRVNSAFCTLFGRTEGDLLGRRLADLGSVEDRTIPRLLDGLVTGSSGRFGVDLVGGQSRRPRPVCDIVQHRARR
ncbi:MAG: PAS domain S-box protein [Marmoricola sp.]